MEEQAEILVQRGQRIVFARLICNNVVKLHCTLLRKLETEYRVMNQMGIENTTESSDLKHNEMCFALYIDF